MSLSSENLVSILCFVKSNVHRYAEVGDGDCGTTHARGARALLEDVVGRYKLSAAYP